MLFLILGIVLGIIAVLFVLQNTGLVTVVFASWQLEGSLALILILTLITGIVVTLLVLLPSFIEDALALSAARKTLRTLEKELEAAKVAVAEAEKKSLQAETLVVTDSTTIM